MSETRMHLDGCHFFAWVYDNGTGDHEVRWYERDGDDLYRHADRDDCERCRSLLDGSAARSAQTIVDLPEDAKGAFVAVVAAIGKLDKEVAAPAPDKEGTHR